MNPEEYLKRTRAPNPGPFLRQNVLQAAENAWHASSPRCRIHRITFHPLTAAASVAFALGIAIFSSEIDRRITASLVGIPQETDRIAERSYFAGNTEIFRNQYWLPEKELMNGLVWNGIGMNLNRELPKETKLTRDQGT